MNSFFASNEYGFRQHASRFLRAVTLLLSICVAPCCAASPKEDFVAWYREWLEAVPQNYSKTYQEFANRGDAEPLTLKIRNWVDGEYRLSSVDNSKTNRRYQLLVNSSYAATIETQSEQDSIWSLSRAAAFRGERDFAPMVSDFGTDPDFLGFTRFPNVPYTLHTLQPGGQGSSEVVFSFQKTPASKKRDPQRIVVTLDGTISWLPTVVTRTEFGGIRTRRTIRGWHLADGTWRYRHMTSHIHTPKTGKEVLHSTHDWDFADQNDAKSDRRSECYLQYYGLPEPGVSAFRWRVLVFAIAVLMCVSGYFLMRKHL